MRSRAFYTLVSVQRELAWALATRPTMPRAPPTENFQYMGMISMVFGVLCGSIGYHACYHFIKRIYGSIKVD